MKGLNLCTLPHEPKEMNARKTKEAKNIEKDEDIKVANDDNWIHAKISKRKKTKDKDSTINRHIELSIN